MPQACGRTSAWLDNDARPELQTLHGRILRFVLLWYLFGLWIVGLASFIGIWTAATPLPVLVQVYLVGMIAYESYHYVTRNALHEWPLIRRVVRYVFLHYPYFRLNAVAAAAAIEENDVTPYVEPDKRALFTFHPHGVLTCGFSFNGAHHMAFQRAACRWISAENLFYFPIMRDILHWMEFSSSTKTSMENTMRTGQNLCLLPGGFEEATLYQRGKHRVYIQKRFGFIKLALQHGYDIYPAYTFGEEYTYHAFPYLQWLRLQLNRFRIPGVIFFGIPFCFFMPRSDVDLITVIGKPLRLPHIDNPSRDEVKENHDKYVEALRDLFDRYKCVYAADPDAELEIF
ncbi:diacylglycerol O-acyltransferase, putative [Phytophthora infestans T30-4]|uniref:Acyltransferase n=1 Tax=Phytophthora infestans (strain T30-4) TaxID=403677 RepID=D0NAL2_PHYIT|nr:diacylglycerol O-acyltransferase, putative [Phytophthora infestans T30-4]EEY54870.1 diacylglycerol O-acyltransferase, putative [Phytophthora infestans T30-4]|eukprot:XP_002903815.1 diacylglycerol O-acyltransferase, putative [Phytophthora infestans T30-4]